MIRKSERQWVEYTMIGLDRVILRASHVSSVVAAGALKHVCHPQMVRFIRLGKKATA